MKKLLLFSVVIIAFAAKRKPKLKTPVGMEEIGFNLFADQSEVNNSSFQAFVDWQNKFGSTSYSPDTSVWDEFNLELKNHYFQHVIFESAPVVGINLASAQAYCKWKTDRVLEDYLTQKGIIEPCSDSGFTAQKYYEGKWQGKIPDPTIPFIQYRLPTIDEWKKLAGKEQLFHKAPFWLDTTLNKFGHWADDTVNLFVKKPASDTLFTTINPYDVYAMQVVPTGNSELDLNEIGLNNIIGGVAELTTLGHVMGGHWNQNFSKIRLDSAYQIQLPSALVGFRCVASYDYWIKEKSKSKQR